METEVSAGQVYFTVTQDCGWQLQLEETCCDVSQAMDRTHFAISILHSQRWLHTAQGFAKFSPELPHLRISGFFTCNMSQANLQLQWNIRITLICLQKRSGIIGNPLWMRHWTSGCTISHDVSSVCKLRKRTCLLCILCCLHGKLQCLMLTHSLDSPFLTIYIGRKRFKNYYFCKRPFVRSADIFICLFYLLLPDRCSLLPGACGSLLLLPFRFYSNMLLTSFSSLSALQNFSLPNMISFFRPIFRKCRLKYSLPIHLILDLHRYIP